MNSPEKDFESNLSYIRHELRSPLNAILGYAEILIKAAEDRGQEDLLPNLKKIQTSGRQLLGRINTLLKSAQTGSGEAAANWVDLDLQELVEEVAAMFDVAYKERPLKWQVDVDRQQRRVRADEGELVQVLINLLASVADLTESGDIELTLSGQSESKYRIEVGATGPLLDAFKQGQGGPQGGGAGPDLDALGRRVERVGGHLSLDQEPDGKVRFSFVLDLSSPQDQADTRPEPETDGEAPDLNLTQVILPEPLLARLKEAAETHSLTDIKKYIDEVGALGAEGRPLAAHLHRLIQRFDMDAILKLLTEVRHE